MATQNLTVRSIEGLKPGRTRYEVFDVLTPGLAIRVTPSGHKSWVLLYRYHGRLRRLTLGRYPDRKLAEARRGSAATHAAVSSMMPTLPRRSRTSARRTATPSERSTSLYKKATEKKRSWPEQRRIFENEVLPAWRHRRVQDMTRRDIRMLVDRKAETAPIMANRILARVSRLFSFAVERDWIEANPALRIVKPADEKSRDRVLSRDELRELWTALHQTEAKDPNGKSLPRLSQTLNDAFIVMLLTAQRCGEVCRMQWREVDLATGWWTIPADVSKNHDPHRVPLTAPVLEVLQRRRFGADDRYVFSNHRHTCVSARAKKAASTLSKGLSFEFRAHDLRRTAASFMGEAGVDRFHIAHVLNHRSVTHSTVTAIYDRYRYDKEKRAALETWAKLLECIVEALSHVRENSESMA